MPWLKLSDEWGTHPKFADPATGALCQLLHARSLCYVGRYLTDGFLPASIIPTLLLGFENLGIMNGVHGQDAMEVNWSELMVVNNLWETADGGYRIHDYLAYNPSKKQVETARKLQQRGGKHSQQIQQARRYHQSQPQGSPQATFEVSPVPVSGKKEKERSGMAVDNSENSRSRVVALPQGSDRTTKGFESASTGLKTVLGKLASHTET